MIRIVNLCITDREKNNFLFINRIKPPYVGYWGMLGGKIKENEEHFNAAIRELEEESGIVAEGRFLGKCHEKIFSNNELKYEFEIYFYHFIIEDREINHDSGEGELKWFHINEFENIRIIPSDISMINNFLNSKMKNAFSLVMEDEGEYAQNKFEEIVNI